jgi:hypothetical protein
LFSFDKPYTETMWGKYNYLNSAYSDKGVNWNDI